VHFGKGEAKVFPLSEDMPVPREPAVQVEAEVFNIVSLGEHEMGSESCQMEGFRGKRVQLQVSLSETLFT
jgi:hypothetical protein